MPSQTPSVGSRPIGALDRATAPKKTQQAKFCLVYATKTRNRRQARGGNKAEDSTFAAADVNRINEEWLF